MTCILLSLNQQDHINRIRCTRKFPESCVECLAREITNRCDCDIPAWKFTCVTAAISSVFLSLLKLGRTSERLDFGKCNNIPDMLQTWQSICRALCGGVHHFSQEYMKRNFTWEGPLHLRWCPAQLSVFRYLLLKKNHETSAKVLQTSLEPHHRAPLSTCKSWFYWKTCGMHLYTSWFDKSCLLFVLNSLAP